MSKHAPDDALPGSRPVMGEVVAKLAAVAARFGWLNGRPESLPASVNAGWQSSALWRHASACCRVG